MASSFFLFQWSRGGNGKGKGNLLLLEFVIKTATFLASKLLSVTVQPWEERIPMGKDNLLLRECVVLCVYCCESVLYR
jgi:hypothetical protein